MSTSTRNRRGTIYPYAGTQDGSFATPTYGPARGTCWCRFSPAEGDEITAGMQAEHRDGGVFEFSDLVTVEVDDLIVENDRQWKVAAVTLRRGLRAKIVRAFATSDTPTLAVS